MRRGEATSSKRDPTRNDILLGLLLLLGLSFWFFLGFPFANHNESYWWMRGFLHLGLADVLTRPMEPVSTFRPLGVGLAWLSFHLSGGSLVPIQVINYALAAVAWLLAFAAIDQKRSFATVGALAGGAFFSGYIYLFHLHGVFYSPLLVFIAVLFWVARNGRVSKRALVAVSVAAAICSLFHTFALLIYASFVAGLALNDWKDKTLSKPVLLALLIAAIVGMKLAVPSDRVAVSVGRQMQGLLVSFQMIELNKAVALLSFFLAVVTVASLKVRSGLRLGAIGGIVACSAVFLEANLPIVFIWIAVCLAKAIMTANWTAAAMLLAASSFPVSHPSGSPTYAVFALMIACWITCSDWNPLEERLRFLDTRMFVPVLAVVALVLVIGCRTGIIAGPLAKIVRPVLAERERSFQLERGIRWILDSDYRGYPVWLGASGTNPSLCGRDATSREHRAPTSQHCLDEYFRSIGKARNRNGASLVVDFGEVASDCPKAVFVDRGKFAGDMTISLVRDDRSSHLN